MFNWSKVKIEKGRKLTAIRPKITATEIVRKMKVGESIGNLSQRQAFSLLQAFFNYYGKGGGAARKEGRTYRVWKLKNKERKIPYHTLARKNKSLKASIKKPVLEKGKENGEQRIDSISRTLNKSLAYGMRNRSARGGSLRSKRNA